MKIKTIPNSKIILAAVGLLFALSACALSTADLQETSIQENGSLEADIPETNNLVVEADLDDAVSDSVEPVEPVSVLPSSTGSQLSQIESEGLLFMREEEKLARDVYLYLYQFWGMQVFNNIAQSEETHTNAVLTLIERYGLIDPASSTGQGEFINSDLQTLYDQLVAEGSLSLKDAFLVGAAIEEIDILDLQDYLEDTDQADILEVYENLIKGSSNHLQAFVRNLSNQIGESYAPQYLSQEAFDEIISSSPGNGQQGKRGNGWN